MKIKRLLIYSSKPDNVRPTVVGYVMGSSASTDDDIIVSNNDLIEALKTGKTLENAKLFRYKNEYSVVGKGISLSDELPSTMISDPNTGLIHFAYSALAERQNIVKKAPQTKTQTVVAGHGEKRLLRRTLQR